jgi:filamentous hemagglutinin family protein
LELHRRRLLLLACTALVSGAGGFAFAGPNGGTVVGGSGSISGQGTSSVTVNQSSQNLIINWSTFNIAKGENTTFNQPNSTSIALNKVIGGMGPSFIDGTLTANGRVFIINGDGILIGPNGAITTSGFLATTSNIRNEDFMAGKYNFTPGSNPSASVVNLGNITATSGGFAALVAPGVRNSGTITATLGTVSLAAGNSFTLDFYGDKLITLAVGDQIASQVIDVATGKPLKSLVGNDGKLSANGGRVELTAAAARAVVDSVINNTGVIEANSVGTKNGLIVLSAATADTKPAGAPTQTVKLSGTISAAGKTKGTKGGTVAVSGEKIQLASANIDASGDAGGGHVLIGGDTGGGKVNPAAAAIELAKLESFVIPTASTVSVDSASTINASATGSGNGGKVVLWSDQQTTFAGTILAQGGPAGGNGGFVETSSHGQLNFSGIVDLRAPLGNAGNLLLDPADFYINPNIGAPAVPTGASVMTESQIETQLALGNLTITTDATVNPTGQNGDIWVNSNINWTSNSTLTLSAYHDINIASGITIANLQANSDALKPGGNLVLRADNTGTGIGTVNFASGEAGYGNINFSGSTGTVSIYYNPSGNDNSTVNAASYKNPTNFSNYVSGSLTAYMLVNTVFDLQNMQNSLGGTYALGRNIDASATANWNAGAGFAPIGSSGSPFTGLFDGQGYQINQLSINSSAQLVGLFGQNSGTIRNVALTNASVTTPGTAQFLGILAGINTGSITLVSTGGQAGNYSGITPNNQIAGGYGGLVGLNGANGAISNSYSTASIKVLGPTSNGYVDGGGLAGQNLGTISFSYAQGAVSGQNDSEAGSYLGGLVGWNRPGGLITQSYASGPVTGAGSNTVVGGLVGVNEQSASITLSYALGAVTGSIDVGGLVGANSGTVTQAYATGTAGGTGWSDVGALIGYNASSGKVTQSYWDTTVAGSTPAIGFDLAGSSDVKGLTTAGFMTASNFVGWNFGATGGASCANGGACWVIVDANGSLNNAGDASGATKPFLLSEFSANITNSHQLQLAVLQPNASYTLANDIALGADLQNPSNMWSTVGFVPIGNASPGGFTGTFNGQSHTIDGLTISPIDASVNTIGLFASIGASGVVQNLNLTNASVAANPSFNNGLSQFVGILAGQNTGAISNVLVTGAVNGGSLSGVIAGGLVGQNGAFSNNSQTATPGTITQSFANVNVTVGDGCQGLNCIGGQVSAGGLVGSNVPGSTITHSQAIGTVAGGAFAYVGGLVGQNWGTIAGTATFTLPTTLASNTTLVSMSDSAPSLTCTVSIGFSCASGAVSVGTQGVAGGLVGWNDGIISYAYATGPVTGTAGVAPAQSGNNLDTLLGGLAGSNQGQISFAFAVGTVGTVDIAYLQAGGLVAQNSGSILNAFAIGNVFAGDNSQAGGLTGGNSPSGNTSPCNGCIVGDGHNNLATIQSALAIGNITVGAASFGGGLSGTGDGTFISTSAFGNVTGGANSTLGGLVGGMGAGNGPSAIQTSLAFGAVASTGPNSSVGGLVGINGGTIVGSVASGPVSGTSQSYLGGLVGINIGAIESSSSSSTVTGSGAQNYAGGAVGLNFGLIDPTTSSGNVASGINSVVGGFAGGNGAFSNFPNQQISNSSFPIGSISVDSLASGTPSGGVGSTVGPQIGLNFPTTGLPAFPSLINTCNNAVCTVLSTGVLTDPNPPVLPPPIIPNNPLPPPDNAPPPPPPTQAQLIQDLVQNIVLVSVTLGDVVNTQSLNQPPPGAPPPGPGGLPPQFGPRFFVPPPPGTQYVPNELVLQIPNNIPPAQLQSVLASLHLSIIASQPMGLLGVTSYQVHIDNGQAIAAVIAALASKQIVAGAQANYTWQLAQDAGEDPNLAGLTQGEGDAAQYALGKLGLIDIHRQLKGSNISIAVIDSQIDVKHPDLEGDIAAEFDAVGAPDQPHAHGTGMAGAIAAHRRLMGIAPAARIYAVHAFSSGAASAESTTFNILKGLEWAAEKGVRVINMSFAGPRDPSMERALKAAHDKGIVLIAAAGNAGPKSPPLYPGADPNVIAVTATDVDDKLFNGANRGKYIAVAAPGVDILVPAPDNTFQLTTGTSVASAEVSGIAALLLERNPALGPEDVRKILTASAHRLGKGDRDDDFGSGLVDPSKAVQTAGDYRSTAVATGAIPPRPAPATRLPALPRAPLPPGLSSSPASLRP